MPVERVLTYEDLGLRDYKETWDYQEELFRKMLDAKMKNRDLSPDNQVPQDNRLILVEHPHVYTLGRSGSDNNLLVNERQLKERGASFYRINRGGDITYHGPGQIVGYPLLDLEEFGMTLKEYIHNLEEVMILTLAEYGIEAGRLEGATGVWVHDSNGAGTRKVCAIGVKASRHITMHGFAFNINTDLDYFNYINPCGYTDKGVTSLAKELGYEQDYLKAKGEVKKNFGKVFGTKWVN